jgi:hypothetical protein
MVPLAPSPPLASSLRRRPRRDSLLRKVVRENLPDFRRLVRETYEKPLPRYVLDEFHAYLRCGDFRHGFTKAHCPDCGHVLLVPFSCKGRGYAERRNMLSGGVRRPATPWGVAVVEQVEEGHDFA